MKYSTYRQNLTKTSIVVLGAIAPAIVTACGMTSTAQTGQTIPPPPEGQTSVLVDDLEDGDRFNEFQGTWFTYDDRNQGGDSQVIPEGYSAFKASPGGPDGSSLAASIAGKVTTTYEYGFLGMGTDLNSPNDPVDISQYNAIEFWAKGDGKSYRMKLRSPVTGDYDDFGYNFAPTPEWQRYVVSFDQLQQEGWGKKVNRDNVLKQVISVTWQTRNQPHDSIELAVDNIRFIQQ